MTTPNLERASNNNFLWPPIADAVDTFLRRRHNQADPYECTWRLVHVWESVEITLAVAALSRLGTDGSTRELLRRIREHFYGTYWDETTRSTRTLQGAAEGSIDQWINILDEVAKADALSGNFLISLKAFLENEAIDLSELVKAWANACDVPPEACERRSYKIRQAMRHVNSLRNRLAHVPFPHDPLEMLAESLEGVTQQLFGTDPVPIRHEKEGRSSALTGAFRVQRSFLHGTHRDTLEDNDGDDRLLLVFPMQKRGADDIWPAGPFVHLDAMHRPHVLTRVKGFDDACEYTRFRAEANAISIRDRTGIEAVFPRPKSDEYVKEEERDDVAAGVPSDVQRPATTMDEAIEAIRREDYDKAIDFFDEMARERPDYHVGLLRLGHAQREKAVRLASDNSPAARDLLEKAIANLDKAAGHREVEYQAQAIYERSKAHYHVHRIDGTSEQHVEKALSDARRACELHGDPKYQTWLEHVVRSTQRT